MCQACVPITGSEDLDFALQKREQVPRNFRLTATDVIKSKSVGARMLTVHPTRLAVEDAPLFGEARSLLETERAIDRIHGGLSLRFFDGQIAHRAHENENGGGGQSTRIATEQRADNKSHSVRSLHASNDCQQLGIPIHPLDFGVIPMYS